MNFSDFVRFISFLIPITSVIGIIVGIYYLKSLNSVYRCLTFYLFLMAFVELLTKVLGYFGNNLIVLHLYSLLELGFFLFLYNKYLLRKYNKPILVVGAIGLIYIIGELLLYHVFNTIDVKEFQPYCKVADNFVIIVMALAFYLERISRFKESGWDYFQLNTVVLTFFTINLIVFLPFNFLVNEHTGLKFYFWLVNIIMILLFYLYLTCVLWLQGRRAINKPLQPSGISGHSSRKI